MTTWQSICASTGFVAKLLQVRLLRADLGSVKKVVAGDALRIAQARASCIRRLLRCCSVQRMLTEFARVLSCALWHNSRMRTADHMDSCTEHYLAML